MSKGKIYEQVELNQREVSLLLRAHCSLKGHPQPLCICSNPGIGKSEMVKAAAAAAGATWENKRYFEVRASQLVDSSDLTGLPMIIKKTRDIDGHTVEYDHTTRYSIPELLPIQREDSTQEELDATYVLFFDEINRSSDPAIMNAIFQMSTEFRINQHKLMPNTIMILAINPDNTGYAVNEMCPALINRINFVFMRCDTEPWLDWAQQPSKADPDKTNVLPVIRDYIASHPKMLSSDGIITKEGDDKRFPTPRAWKNLSDAIGRYNLAFDTHNKLDLSAKIMSGIVGYNAAFDFADFARTALEDRPLNGEEVLKHYRTSKEMQEKVKHEDENGRRTYDVTKVSITYRAMLDKLYTRKGKLTLKEAKNFIQFLLDITAEQVGAISNELMGDKELEFTQWFVTDILGKDKEAYQMWEQLKSNLGAKCIGVSDLLEE